MNKLFNKYNFLTVLLFCTGLSANAQKALQFTPQAGASFNLLNKNIFLNKSVLISPLVGLSINKQMSKKFIIGIEAQYTQYNLGNAVQEQYSRFFTNSSIKSFSPSAVINGLLNVGYTANKGGTTKGNNGVRIELGAGVQRLTTGGNILQVPNPFLNNELTTVYSETKSTSTNPIVQLSLTKSWELKPCLLFDVSLKAQYIRYNNKAMYKPIPSDTGQVLTERFFFNNPEQRAVTHRPFTFIPAIGLRFVLGGCRKPKPPKEEPQQPTASCFDLQWKNAVPKDSCFRGDTLQFAFTQKNLVPGATGYEIYIAAVNDLNNEKLLYSLSYPAGSFNINPVLLDADKEYVVIVKLRNSKKENECIQFIQPVKRCADCCKDIMLPE